MHHFQNAFMLAADRMSNSIAKPRLGLVSGYDPNTYMVKVQLQPENVETGWLPLGSPGVGNGFGIFAAPAIGDQVEVQFPDGDLSSGIVSMRFYSDVARPLAVPSGEVWIVHSSGSFLKFHNDGSIEVSATAGISYTASAHTFHGPVTMDKTLQVTQDVTAGGNISDQNGNKGTVQKIRDQYDVHTHSGVQTGSGNTSIPSNSL